MTASNRTASVGTSGGRAATQRDPVVDETIAYLEAEAPTGLLPHCVAIDIQARRQHGFDDIRPGVGFHSRNLIRFDHCFRPDGRGMRTASSVRVTHPARNVPTRV